MKESRSSGQAHTIEPQLVSWESMLKGAVGARAEALRLKVPAELVLSSPRRPLSLPYRRKLGQGQRELGDLLLQLLHECIQGEIAIKLRSVLGERRYKCLSAVHEVSLKSRRHHASSPGAVRVLHSCPAAAVRAATWLLEHPPRDILRFCAGRLVIPSFSRALRRRRRRRDLCSVSYGDRGRWCDVLWWQRGSRRRRRWHGAGLVELVVESLEDVGDEGRGA